VRGGVELRTRERRQRGLAARDEPDRLEQLGRRRRLVDEPVGAGDARQQLDLGIGQRRVEDDARTLSLRLHPPAQRDAVALEQAVLEQHDVRALARDQLLRVGAARRGADGNHAGLRAEEHYQARADCGLRVDDGDAGHGGQPSQRCFNPT
jgi:hypothetical protein